MAIGIQFWSYGKWSRKHYTYHCVLDVAVGDLVVVDARGDPSIVRVAVLNMQADDDKVTYKQVRAKLPSLLPSIMSNTALDDEEARLRKEIEDQEAELYSNYMDDDNG